MDRSRCCMETKITKQQLHHFLNSRDFEGLKDYKEEAEVLYSFSNLDLQISDIMTYWKMRFYPNARHAFTASTAIYNFLKG